VNGEDLDATAAPQVIVRSGQDPAVRVLLHDRQFIDQDLTAFAIDLRAGGLAAHHRDVIVAVSDPEGLSDFADGLAADFRGWSGSRSWAADHLKLTASFHSGGHVELRWTAPAVGLPAGLLGGNRHHLARRRTADDCSGR
jgi:Family of unknown function (DUF6228)